MRPPTRRGLLTGIAAGGATGLLRPGSAAVLGTAEKAPGAAPSFPPIDVARIAQRVVASLQPSAGERAILVYDPAYYPDLTHAIERDLLEAGIHPFVALAFEAPEIANALDARPGGAKRQAEFVALLQPVFDNADIFMWLPARRLVDDTRFEHLQGASRARGIHFHWVFEPAGKSGEEIATLTRMYERAILETDYPALSARQDRIIAVLRGRALHLATPDGTDLTLTVPADAWFHRNDGDMSVARARQALCVRDREMEFPAGALRFIPDAGSAEGRLVVRRVGTPGGIAEGAVFEFAEGRVRTLRAEKRESALRAEWERIGGDVDRVGEIVLGTSPWLVGKLPSGELPYFGYGDGYVRVSLGDNWESGGKNRTPGNRNLWLFLEEATLEADGIRVIEKGKLAIP